MIINGHEITRGFNINDKHLAFTKDILLGWKSIETRDSHSLDSLIGQRVAIIRTGKGPATIVGLTRITGCKTYADEDSFNADWKLHRVSPWSRYHIINSKYGYKIGYFLEDVEPCVPTPCTSRGNVIRNL